MSDGDGVTMVFNDNNRGKSQVLGAERSFMVIKQRNNRGKIGSK